MCEKLILETSMELSAAGLQIMTALVCTLRQLKRIVFTVLLLVSS